MSTLTPADVVDFRRRRNLSRKALAHETGLTEGKIWRIENKGNISADEERSLQLVGVTAVSMDEALPARRLITADVIVPGPPPLPIVGKMGTTAGIPWDQRVSTVEVDFAALVTTADGPTYDRYVSNSELQTFKTCRRKWWLAWHRGLHEIAESPVGVRQIGNRLHRALKAHYVPHGQTPVDLLEELERLIMLDRSAVKPFNEETAAKFEKEADLERIMLEGYLEWIAQTGADAELQVIHPETYVEVALEEFDGKLAIIGKMDVRVRRTSDNAHLFIDHKSVAELKSPTLMLPLDEQMLHYHLLETLDVPEGEHAAGALYNMLRRVKRTSKAAPPFYARIEVRHNLYELASYRRRMVGEITDILEVQDQLNHGASHQSVAYPRPSRDCTWSCQFFSVCPMFDDGSRAEDMLSQYFRKGDPLEYYQNEVLGGVEE